MNKYFFEKKNGLPQLTLIFFLFALQSFAVKGASIITLPIKNHRIGDLSKNEPDVLYKKALALYSKEDYMKALVKFSRTINEFPKYDRNDGVKFFIGNSLEKIGMDKVASKNYVKLIEMYPESPVVPFANLGLLKIAYRNGSSDVEVLYKKITKSISPDSLKFHALYYYGEDCLKKGKNNEAANCFMKIPETHPEYLFAQHSLAIALSKIDKTDPGIILALDNVIAKNPSGKYEKEIVNRSYLFLGYTYYEGSVGSQKKLAAAVAALRKVPENSIYYTNALIGIAWTALNAGQWPDCIASSQRLRMYTNDNLYRVESMLLEAYCYMLDKKFVIARNLLVRAIEVIEKGTNGESETLKRNYSLTKKKYLNLALRIDSLVNVGFHNVDKKSFEILSKTQTDFKIELDDLLKNIEIQKHDDLFNRSENEIKEDVEYALSKVNKNIGVKTEHKVLEKATEEISDVGGEMKKLQEQLRSLEAEDSSPMVSKVIKKKFELKTDDVYLDKSTPLLILSGDDAKKRMKNLSEREMLKAGSHDDNEEFTFYQDYCKKYGKFRLNKKWDINERYIVKCVDSEDKPIPFAKVDIYNKRSSRSLFNAKTLANGEIVLFPYMDLDEDYTDIESYYAKVNGREAHAFIKGPESLLLLKEKGARVLSDTIPVQICFLLDATGSMKDEINELKDVIFSIHHRIISSPTKPQVSFSTVAYRDISDAFHFKDFDFTDDIDQFQENLEEIEAGGGGDYPEDLDKGLEITLENLSWKKGALKFVFLIGDAPPHLDYDREKDYVWAMNKAREEGIMICPIGASGLKPIGEFIYRQIGVLTNGEFIFLHYGENGESDGGGTTSDPGKVSHHTGSNYNVKKLDDIVVNIISKELSYVTDKEQIVYSVPEPKTESGFLDSRIENILGQIFSQNIKESLKDDKIVISPFTYKDSIFTSLSDHLWETTIEKVTELSKMQVLERQRVEEIFKEHSLDMSGATGLGGESNIGKLFSSDYMILSSLKFLGSVRVCHMRLVDCKNGAIISAARIKL